MVVQKTLLSVQLKTMGYVDVALFVNLSGFIERIQVVCNYAIIRNMEYSFQKNSYIQIVLEGINK